MKKILFRRLFGAGACLYRLLLLWMTITKPEFRQLRILVWFKTFFRGFSAGFLSSWSAGLSKSQRQNKFKNVNRYHGIKFHEAFLGRKEMNMRKVRSERLRMSPHIRNNGMRAILPSPSSLFVLASSLPVQARRSYQGRRYPSFKAGNLF